MKHTSFGHQEEMEIGKFWHLDQPRGNHQHTIRKKLEKAGYHINYNTK